MIAYAEHVFARSRPAADGATEGDHSDSAKRQWAMLGKRPKKPEKGAPKFPEALDYLWRWFGEIFEGCSFGDMAPVQVGWRDLQAWSVMTGTILAPWEARTLIRLGSAYVTSRLETKAKPDG